jgi:hypothetical protein
MTEFDFEGCSGRLETNFESFTYGRFTGMKFFGTIAVQNRRYPIVLLVQNAESATESPINFDSMPEIKTPRALLN